MPPPRTSPFRTVTDWLADPYFTPEERDAWDRDRKKRWVAALTDADWQKLTEATDRVSSVLPMVAVNDLDAPFRVGVLEPGFQLGSGVRFGTLKGFVLVAWERVKGSSRSCPSCRTRHPIGLALCPISLRIQWSRKGCRRGGRGGHPLTVPPPHHTTMRTRMSDTQTFYRVKAGHEPGKWVVGELGDGLFDRAFMEKYYKDCIDGGWPHVQFEEVTVRVVMTHAPSPATQVA